MEASQYDTNYIEHEVQIRVLKETTESKFALMQRNFDDKFTLMQQNFDSKFSLMQKNIDERFSHVDSKINIIIGIGVAALLIPLIKSALGVL